jgi:hypothetical protein
VQRKVLLAWAAQPNVPDREIARAVEMKPAAFSRAFGRALEAANLTRFMANVLRGGNPHTVRALSLSGLGGV